MKKLSHEGESWFSKKILSIDSILSQFSTSFEFSWVKSTDKIFLIGKFQVVKGDLGTHPQEI